MIEGGARLGEGGGKTVGPRRMEAKAGTATTGVPGGEGINAGTGRGGGWGLWFRG